MRSTDQGGRVPPTKSGSPRTSVAREPGKANPLEFALVRADPQNMSPDEADLGPFPIKTAEFTTTHWSVVVDAGRGDSPEASLALDRLCRTYWYPIYVFVRRKGYGPEEAEDLTQEFFARLIRQRDLQAVRREKGRFRSYLLVSLKHFLINEWKRGQTQKRGGGQTMVPLDLTLAENLYSSEAADPRTPEHAFDQRWAVTLLETVLRRLEAEYAASGRASLFSRLRCQLPGESSSQSQEAIGIELGLSEGAVKQSVHRLRRRCRELLREEISQTLATRADVEDEFRHLIALLRS
jgi:RNA polymerase sigma-70 factor (ECF subfamily)